MGSAVTQTVSFSVLLLVSSLFPGFFTVRVSSLGLGQELAEAQAGSRLEGRTGILTSLLCSGWAAGAQILP